MIKMRYLLHVYFFLLRKCLLHIDKPVIESEQEDDEPIPEFGDQPPIEEIPPQGPPRNMPFLGDPDNMVNFEGYNELCEGVFDPTLGNPLDQYVSTALLGRVIRVQQQHNLAVREFGVSVQQQPINQANWAMDIDAISLLSRDLPINLHHNPNQDVNLYQYPNFQNTIKADRLVRIHPDVLGEFSDLVLTPAIVAASEHPDALY